MSRYLPIRLRWPLFGLGLFGCGGTPRIDAPPPATAADVQEVPELPPRRGPSRSPSISPRASPNLLDSRPLPVGDAILRAHELLLDGLNRNLSDDVRIQGVVLSDRNAPAEFLPRGRSPMQAGDDVLSHPVSRAVPSARRGLTTVFGMGTGVALAPLPPAKSWPLPTEKPCGVGDSRTKSGNQEVSW